MRRTCCPNQHALQFILLWLADIFCEPSISTSPKGSLKEWSKRNCEPQEHRSRGSSDFTDNSIVFQTFRDKYANQTIVTYRINHQGAHVADNLLNGLQPKQPQQTI